MSRRFIYRSFASAALSLVLMLTSCTYSARTEEANPLFAFDTVFYQTAVGGDETLFADTARLLNEEELLFSRTLPESQLYKLNLEGRATVSRELFLVVEEALRLSEQTGGAFDPTLAALSDLWDFTKAVVPSEADIQEARKQAGPQKVTLEGETLSTGGTTLDLGGIAKGYAVGQILSLYRERGVTGGIVSCSSSVGVTGTKADGSLYRVGIRDPGTEEGLLGTLALTDALLSTSGDYERFFLADGVRYHHILDPETGYPARTGLRSVTVVASLKGQEELSLVGARTDALSTALFVMGYGEESLALLSDYDMEAIFVTDEGILLTKGLEEAFSLSEGGQTLTVVG